jgi:hypothetical protein
MEQATAKEIGGLLFSIHLHAEQLLKYQQDAECGQVLDNPDEIIYREEDIISLLVALGYPAPEWGTVLTIKEFQKAKDQRLIPKLQGT